MHYVVVRSVWTAIRGPSGGWSKQERKATGSARDVLKPRVVSAALKGCSSQHHLLLITLIPQRLLSAPRSSIMRENTTCLFDWTHRHLR